MRSIKLGILRIQNIMHNATILYLFPSVASRLFRSKKLFPSKKSDCGLYYENLYRVPLCFQRGSKIYVPVIRTAAVTKCIFLSLSSRDINLHNPRCGAHAILHLIEARISFTVDEYKISYSADTPRNALSIEHALAKFFFYPTMNQAVYALSVCISANH